MRLHYLIAAGLVSLTPVCMAKSEFLDTFMKTYKISEDSPLGQKSCEICHASEDDYAQFNPYGRDIKKALADAGTNVVTPQILATVGKLDSNNNGKINSDEIAAGLAPGETRPGDAATGAPAPPPPPKSFIPKNGFHPAIVHFPIALFIAGLLLDFLGLTLKHKEMLYGGWYCIVIGAVSAIGGIGSGFFAYYLQHLPMKGVIQLHMALALIATVLMFAMVALRVHRHEKMNLPSRISYYIMAAVCLVLISWVGHLGGVFVYGS